MEVAMTQPTHAPPPAGPSSPPIQRQFVNFAFYRIDPAIRRLPDEEKWQARSAFLKAFEFPREKMICLTYSTAGLKSDTDFLLWRITLNTDVFQEQTQLINKSRLGGYLTTPYSFLAMTKRIMYIDKL